MHPDENRSSDSSPEDVEALKRLVAGIVRTQGNRFIKELLRSENIRIGATKDDFEANLTAAIDGGELQLKHVEAWLREVEGWGNQHVYLFKILPVLEPELSESAIRARLQDSPLMDLWDAPTALNFPDELTPTSISFQESVLRVVWQESSEGWTPVPTKNKTKVEGLDTFQYRAYRQVQQRAVTRFEADVEKGLAALFIPLPIQGEEHQAAVAAAKTLIAELIDLPTLERGQVDISDVSRNLDQANIPTNKVPVPPVKTQRSRLASGGAYVEFAATSSDNAYSDEPAVHNVRNAIKPAQLEAFEGTDGVFTFREVARADGQTRELRVQLYGGANRVRLWAQMERDEVWNILSTLATNQSMGAT
jgi:hypothetical protein